MKGLIINSQIFIFVTTQCMCAVAQSTTNSTTNSYKNNCYYGKSGTDLQNYQNVGQTVTFATLVIVQTFDKKNSGTPSVYKSGTFFRSMRKLFHRFTERNLGSSLIALTPKKHVFTKLDQKL